jgi:CRP/FNR family transcriptional regulator
MHCACSFDDCVLCEGRLFNGLSSEQACAVKGLIRHHVFPARAPLFREGAQAEQLLIVKSGCVKLTSTLPDGREQILRLAGAGQLLGLESLSQPDYPYSAYTLTVATACSVRLPDLQQILAHNPDVALRVIGMLSEELSRSGHQIRDLGLKSSTERMASFLLALGHGQPSQGCDAELLLTRQEIAELLGLTVETVSRMMAWLKRAGIIYTARGRIRILNARRLRELTGELPPSAPSLRARTPRAGAPRNAAAI